MLFLGRRLCCLACLPSLVCNSGVYILFGHRRPGPGGDILIGDGFSWRKLSEGKTPHAIGCQLTKRSLSICKRKNPLASFGQISHFTPGMCVNDRKKTSPWTMKCTPWHWFATKEIGNFRCPLGDSEINFHCLRRFLPSRRGLTFWGTARGSYFWGYCLGV